MRLLDANAFVGRAPAKPTTTGTMADLTRELGRLGFSGGIVTSFTATHHDPVSGNRELAGMLAGQRAWRGSWLLIPGTPGEAPDPDAQVAEARELGMAAVRVMPATLGHSIADVASGLGAAAEAGLPLQVDLTELGWDGVDALCGRHPDLTVVVSRCSYRALRRIAPIVSARPNLMLDTVDFSTHEGWEWFVEHLGANRLLLATGAPTREPGEATTRLQWSRLDAAAKEKIAWGNAVRVFGLDEPADAAGTQVEADGTSDELATAVLGATPWSGDMVDAHAHLGPYSLFTIPDSGADEMVRVMDLTGCRTAVLSTNRAIQQDAWAGNAEAAAAAAAHPGRLAAYGVVNPWQDPDRMVEEIAANPAYVGIKLHPGLHEYPLTGPRYRVVWEWAASSGCPVLTHTWFGSLTDSPPILATIAEQYPEAVVLLGHSGATPYGNDITAQLAARYPGLHAETCGSYSTARLLADMIDVAGPDKVLFGSDFPFIDQRIALGRVTFTGLEPAVRDAVMAGNARRLFGWRDRRAS